ncbi:MAG: metal ABC transporter substrate-binding protein [Rothia sp. (in: high G+C Gram-positive bacteria)]|nr:metal ABC transporter substrate-binding protein [Rothia sp. (in: high G+C Gram-positive bacteria)]
MTQFPPAHRSQRPSRLRTLMATVAIVSTGLLSACAPNSTEASSHKPQVLATFTVLADIAQNVGGDYIDVQSLTKPGAEIHEYEPTPSDVRKAADADLILANGLNLETWLNQFLHDSEAPSVTVTQGIDPITITEDAGAGKPNPHAWMSPLAAQTYVDNIAEAFSQLDPEHADAFTANAEAYKKELQKVHDQLVAELADLPEQQRLLVTCEGAFSYLAHDASLEEAYLWAVNSDGQTGSRRIREIADTVEENQVPAVFCESTVSSSSMEQVANETGAHYAGALYVDSLSEEGGPVPTYLDLIRYDAELIAEALGSTHQ